MGRAVRTAASSRVEVGKLFHVRDGHRMVTALAAGLRIGVCTGRDSAPLRRRVQDLRLDPLLVSVPIKLQACANGLNLRALVCRRSPF